MTTFWIFAALLSLVAVAFIVLPLLYSRPPARPDREKLNVAIFEERLSEYQASLDQQAINQEEFDQLTHELKRNLLTESGEQQSDSIDGKRRRLPLTFAALIPVVALALYADFGFSWGAISDLALAEEIQTADPHNQDAMMTMVVKLAKRLENQPDNHDGWFLLAQSQMKLLQYEKAAETFLHLQKKFPRDPSVNSYYAEALYLADSRQLTERVEKAIATTLEIDPHNLTMIELKAVGAFQAKNYELAVEWFRKALAAGADEDRARFIHAAIKRIEEDFGVVSAETEPAAKIAASPEATQATDSEVAKRSLQVLVEVADSVDVGASASVFVFARAVTGPPMPLAVQRMVKGALPKLVILDESMAMMAGMGLANFDQVQVVARISSTGIANVSPDDYEVVSSNIDLTVEQGVIKLLLEKKVKDK